MAADRPMRASDDDRDRVVEILREQTAQGRLTLEEFQERLDRTYAARTWDELRNLTGDLPVRVVFAADERGPAGRSPAHQGGPLTRQGRATVAARPQLLLLPFLVAAVLVGIAAADAWPALPFLLLGVFWLAGPCGRRGGMYSHGTRPHGR